MPLNSEILVHSCIQDIFPDFPTMVDFFGDAFGDDERENVVLGVYQGLVTNKGVTAEMLHNCLQSNRLTKLVHAKYKHQPSGYYKRFCELKINLDPLPLCCLKKEFWLDIYDDDHCPKCHKAGYLTKDNREGLIDCEECLQMMCKFCVGVDGKCKDCSGKEKKEK